MTEEMEEKQVNEIRVFNSDQFGEVRTVTIDDEPWFVAADVCRALEIGNSRMATERLDDDEKGVSLIDTPGGQQELTVINGPGLYSLVLGSRKPEAKAFKRWITHEVIPAIRKHGVYAVDELLNDPDSFIAALQALKEEREKNKKLTGKILTLEPKASYYDLVLSCNNALPITIIAKDYGWSGKKMNQFLAAQNVQYKMGETWLLYAEHSDKGYTKSDTTVFTGSDGTQHSKVYTKWTQKGRLFIYDLMKAAGYLPVMEK